MITLIGCNNNEPNKDNTIWYFVEDGNIKVSLDGNYTTGFEWTYSIKDESIVSFINSNYVENPHEEGMTGVGGVYSAFFKPLKDGETTIAFIYKRNWEDDTSQQKLLLIKINNGLITLQELSE